jgi:hypothetical protein
MIKVFSGLARPVDISFPSLVHACLTSSKRPISREQALVELKLSTLMSPNQVYEFIYVWFERTGDKALAARGEEVCKLLPQLRITSFNKLLTPVIAGIACSHWERVSINHINKCKARDFTSFLDKAICEHILYPLDIHKMSIPYWLLKFYVDLATYWNENAEEDKYRFCTQDLLCVARDKDREVDAAYLQELITLTSLILPCKGDSWEWVDKKIPLFLRGISRREVYKYGTTKLVSTLFK